jgi:hypothetical protein
VAQFNHGRNSVMEEISEDAVPLMCEYLKLIKYLLQIDACEWFI